MEEAPLDKLIAAAMEEMWLTDNKDVTMETLPATLLLSRMPTDIAEAPTAKAEAWT
jgi:hypothetical protein